MIWLYIYIGTIVFYWIAFITLAVELDGYAKRNNLTIEKQSSGEKFSGWVKGIVVGLLPVVNVVFAFMFLFSDSVRASAIRKMKPKDSETSRNEFCKE